MMIIGFRTERRFREPRRLLGSLSLVAIGGEHIAIQAAKNFRALRRRGITVRKTIDALIATRCIEDDYVLLHSDRDFEPFAAHLGLRSVLQCLENRHGSLQVLPGSARIHPSSHFR